jgi:hypothetical protein
MNMEQAKQDPKSTNWNRKERGSILKFGNFLVVLCFALRASCLLGRHSSTRVLPPQHILLQLFFREGLILLLELASDYDPPAFTFCVTGIIGLCHLCLACSLREDLANFLLWLTSNHDPRIWFLNTWNYRHEPPCSASNLEFVLVMRQKRGWSWWFSPVISATWEVARRMIVVWG